MEGAEQLAASKSLRPDPVEADAPEDALSTWLGGVGFIFFFNPGGPRLCPGSPGSRLASLRDVACEDLPRSASLFLVGQHKEPGGKKKAAARRCGKQSCFSPCHCHCQCDVAPRAWAVHGCVRCQLAKKPKQLSLRNVLSPQACGASPRSTERWSRVTFLWLGGVGVFQVCDGNENARNARRLASSFLFLELLHLFV